MRLKKISLCVLPLIAGCTSLCVAGDYSGAMRVWYKPLLPTTGLNSDCDRPVFAIPAPLPADFHIDFLGLYNPNSPAEGELRDGEALAPSDCSESLDRPVATISNLDYMEQAGLPLPDPRLWNLKSDEIPAVIGGDGTRATLPTAAEAKIHEPARLTTARSLTLGEFRGVKGYMKLLCFGEDKAKFSIKLSNYEPGELLTVWASWMVVPEDGGPVTFPAVPFGGVPNVIVPDSDGCAEFRRTLDYCPMDASETGTRLLFLDITTHWDGNVYGALPETPLVSGTYLENFRDPASAYISSLGAGLVSQSRGIIQMTADKY